MTQEEKDLLIKDLSCRLPYNVKVEAKGLLKTIENDYNDMNIINAHVLNGLNLGNHFKTYSINSIANIPLFNRNGVCSIKPYLFPLDSMTEEQKEELNRITNGKFKSYGTYIDNCKPRNWSEWGTTEYNWIRHHDVDLLHTWLDKNHFDYRDLISMGLAIDATGLNIY